MYAVSLVLLLSSYSKVMFIKQVLSNHSLSYFIKKQHFKNKKNAYYQLLIMIKINQSVNQPINQPINK